MLRPQWNMELRGSYIESSRSGTGTGFPLFIRRNNRLSRGGRRSGIPRYFVLFTKHCLQLVIR